MSKKGQALVEFIIILPVFLLLVLGVMDIGKIMYNKTMLEGAMSEVVSMYQKGNSSLEILDKLDIEASLDIELDDIIIQVKSGSAKGLTTQMLNTFNATGKVVISYTPDIKQSSSVLKGVRAKGFNTFTTMDELLKFLNDYYK